MKDVFKKIAPLILAMVIFIGFGLYHITKFETIDEHFWKYDRIEKYTNGIWEGKLKKTRVNDKPGVTTAIISSIGLPFISSPSDHEDVDRKDLYTMTKDSGGIRHLYSLYKLEETPKINLALRLPLLLFNGLVMLPLLFWLLWRAFNEKIASLGILLIGANPILIGISQIINPDTLLWSFSAGALLSFFALLKTHEKKFIVLTGVLTGLTLLSKYTGNLLFLFFALIFIFHTSFQKNTPTSWKSFFMSYAKPFISIVALAWATVILLMPAVILAPKHFLYATIYSPVLAPLVQIFLTPFSHVIQLPNLSDGSLDGAYQFLPLTLGALGVFAILFVLIPPCIALFLRHYPKILRSLGRIGIVFLLSIFILSFTNAWFDTPLFSLDNLKEVSRASGEVSFPQFSNDSTVTFWAKALLIQSQNFIFSLHPIIILSFFSLLLITLFRKPQEYEWLIYFSALMPFIFFVGALQSNVFVNVRYSLMLYPMFMLLAALGLSMFLHTFKWKYSYFSLITFILLASFYSLWHIKPFYFNYESLLLPKQYTVTDAWGYGFYEAAQFLNSLENHQEKVAWVDREGLCQFFTGKCITSREVYLDHTSIDYLVLTRRGSLIRKPLPVTKDPKKEITSFKQYYTPQYMNNPLWELHINDRPKNFIKIIEVAQ